MSTGPFILWLVIELGQLYLTPVASERVVTAILGQTAKLPCVHVGWSQSSNSMCWGRGPCPKSKCNDQLVDTDGVKILSRKSSRYSLRENIQRGDVSLTISNIQDSDSGVYCCRIEVPGWFNDVKQNIRLNVIRVPSSTTPHRPTTTTTTTTTTTSPAITSVTLATTVVSTQDLTTRTLLQTATTGLTTPTTDLTTATSCPSTSGLPSEVTTVLTGELSTEGSELSTEGSVTTAGPETSPLSSTQRSKEEGTSRPLTSPTSQGSLQSASTTRVWETNSLVTLLHQRQSERTVSVLNEAESKQVKTSDNWDLLMIIAPTMGFVLLAVLVLLLLLRGNVKRTYCFQKHTRLSSSGGSKNILSDMPQGREDEDGLFTL